MPSALLADAEWQQGVGWFFGGGSLCGLVTWFVRNVACNSLACMSRFEIGSLGLQRSWGCRRKFGRPNCMRLLCCKARGSNSCVRLSTQGCCLPYLGASGLCSQGLLRAVLLLAALLDEAVVVRVGN